MFRAKLMDALRRSHAHVAKSDKSCLTVRYEAIQNRSKRARFWNVVCDVDATKIVPVQKRRPSRDLCALTSTGVRISTRVGLRLLIN